MAIKLVVTREKYDELFSLDEIMFFGEISNRAMYLKMLQCAVDESGNPLTIEQARQEFAKVKPSELGDYILQFTRAISEALVNPTSGGN